MTASHAAGEATGRPSRRPPGGAGPTLTWLYVPGTRPDRFEKAMRTSADVVILDLQDSVVAGRKAEARRYVRDFAASLGSHANRVQVRINPVATDEGAADLRAVAGIPGLQAIRLPEVSSAADVGVAVEALGPSHRLHCIIESALGVESALAIATASPTVRAIGLGEADLAADLSITDDAGLGWARGRLVVAARAAGLPAPAMSVYPAVDDEAGLVAHCRMGQRLGFLGCAAIHPRQLAAIEQAFRPTDADLAAAREVLRALATAERAGAGATRTGDGRMVDAAMRRRAEQVLALAARAS